MNSFGRLGWTAACLFGAALSGCGSMEQTNKGGGAPQGCAGMQAVPASSYALYYSDDHKLVFAEDARSMPARCAVEIPSTGVVGCTPPQREVISPTGTKYCVPKRP